MVTKQVDKAINSSHPHDMPSEVWRNMTSKKQERRRKAIGKVQRSLKPSRGKERTSSEVVTEPMTERIVTLRVLNGPSYSITPPEDFAAMSMYWEYVLRNRIRWAQDPDAADAVYRRAEKELETLGLDKAKLIEIAKSEIVQLDIPYFNEKVGWELRIFPWEFLLFTATYTERDGPLIVIRHVCCDGDNKMSDAPPKKLMVVESAPGTIGDKYTFSSERRLVESNLQLTKISCPSQPTVNELKRLVKEKQPDVIHLTGFDSHQGKQLLKYEQRVSDGYMLSNEDGKPIYTTAEQLAEALRQPGGRRAKLIACNFWNSAARVAALLAAEVATGAIGFLDEIDDKVAENFFAKFYFNWRVLNWDLLRAFRLTVSDMHFGGAVVVLWSSRSLVEALQSKQLQVDANQVGIARQRETLQDLSGKSAHEVLDVVVKLKGTVNYSLLQNDENLFDEFSIRKLCDAPIHGIEVELTLYVGSDSFPYRKIFSTDQSYVPLAKEIRFPLTSTLMRSLRESVNSVISIKVSWNEQIRYLETQPVKLLAIDEWVDTPELDAYLPCFIFPRDPAVARIIDTAQRYLMALNDDSGAGFDGYQGVDLSTKDPSATVDLQARAIWSALSYDLPLSYINPPPSFTVSSQRLRTPSAVIDGKRGTCIDLALMLAACLEYAGIYPVIFLLTDHAFVGYWRTDKARQDFIDISTKEPASVITSNPSSVGAVAPTPTKPWMFTNYTEVVQLARNGSIVPIETVWLTQHRGFWEAVDEGMSDLRSKREFSSLIDIQGARSHNPPITPLPIIEAFL